MSATTIRLWFVRETDKARCYCKYDHDQPDLTPDDGDVVWVPKSIVEHTTKRGNEHHVKLPDWFIEKNGL